LLKIRKEGEWKREDRDEGDGRQRRRVEWKREEWRNGRRRWGTKEMGNEGDEGDRETKETGNKGDEGDRETGLEHIAVGFPPAIANNSHQGQRCSSKIDDPGIKGFGWFFTHLLGGFGTD
jgi:hypothetical protein